MTKAPDYLRRYRDSYRLVKRGDGVWYILTKHRDRDGGTTFDIYDYSDTHLAACLPVRVGLRLLREHPEAFTLHQRAEDAVVLLFEEARLGDLADVLRVKQRRRMSDAERERLRAWGREHAQEGLRRIAEARKHPVKRGPTARISTFSPAGVSGDGGRRSSETGSV